MLKELIKLNSTVAEGPLWSSKTKSLFWVDIGKKLIHRYKFATETCIESFETLTVPFQPSAIFESINNRLYAVSEKSVISINFETGSHRVVFNTEAINSKHRFNDAKVDKNGRLWLGTMNTELSTHSASVYCLDKNMHLHEADTSFIVSNGLAWSPMQDALYVVETVTRKIYKYNVDIKTGELTDKKVLITFTECEGKPDGITVDIDGNIWVALWDGWAVKCFNALGDLIETIKLPVPRPTSVAFAGEKLDTLIITTARYGLTDEELLKSPLSGSLLSYYPGVEGIESYLFKENNPQSSTDPKVI